MNKVMLKAFTLAAAVVAPHLIAIDAKAVQVRQMERLSEEERGEMELLSEKAVHKANSDTTKERVKL